MMVVNIVLGYALIPQVIKGFKDKKEHIALQTGILTSGGLFAMSFAMWSLDLHLTSGMVFFNALLWATLLFQSLKYRWERDELDFF